jgi:putative nucleotidyltransferase with HDIG domain
VTIAAAAPDPIPIMKGFASLRRLIGAYPAHHPLIGQKLLELYGSVEAHLQDRPVLRIDLINGEAHLDGVASGADAQGAVQSLQDLASLGIHSIHISRGVQPEELRAVAQFLWEFTPGTTGAGGSVGTELARRGVRHVSLGKLVPLDTRWKTEEWPDAPTGPLDPDYAQSLVLAQQTFEDAAEGGRIDLVTIRDLVELLLRKVATSSVALGQILAVKQYENLTYCHSVNVAMLSLLLGRQIGLDEAAVTTLVEAAVLHDIGKTRIPVEILKKPGALDKRERSLMESHTVHGAEILVQLDGLRPLTPVVALEHHRTPRGGGYPDLGSAALPHPLSQIVSVADTYEALTGARSYQAPELPERACLVLARLAGERLNTALVKAFISAVTFFPLGSLVRTNRDEIAVVVRTNASEPLHPVVALLNDGLNETLDEIDTSLRDGSGDYVRHIVETMRPRANTFDLTRLLTQAA